MESGDWGAVPEAVSDLPSASENGQPSSTDSASTSGLFAGGGEVGSLMRQVDWSSTPLGPVETWPQSLQTVVRILLTSRFAMWMGWGPDLTFLYNDTYGRVTLGKKHPWALGKPAREVGAKSGATFARGFGVSSTAVALPGTKLSCSFSNAAVIARKPTTPFPTAP